MTELPSEKEIRAILLERRQLFIQGEISGNTFDYVQDALFVLNHQSPRDPILLWIDSPGGRTHSALATFDLLKISQAPVYGLVTYMAASSASLVLQGCKIRCCLEHSRIHLHGVTHEVSLQAFLEESAKFTEEGRRIQDFVFRVYVERTGRSRSEIERLSREEKPLYAPQALEFGLVDQILGSREDFEKLLTPAADAAAPPRP